RVGLDPDLVNGTIGTPKKNGSRWDGPLWARRDYGTQDHVPQWASAAGDSLHSRETMPEGPWTQGLKRCLTGKGDQGPIDYICFMAKVKNIDTLNLDSSILCCNFVNTVSSWKEQGSHDYLDSYAAFLKWCRKTGAGSPGLLEKLEGSELKLGQMTQGALLK